MDVVEDKDNCAVANGDHESELKDTLEPVSKHSTMFSRMGWEKVQMTTN